METARPNTTTVCPAEPGLKGVFELINSDPNLNITDLVAICPETCGLVLGLGNPDISGIGVNIAYFIQVGTSVFFGLLLYLAILLWPTYFKRRHRIQLLYYEVLDTLVKQNAAFSFPVGVAACFTISQYPTAFELIFLDRILQAQTYCLLIITLPCILLSNKLNRAEVPAMNTTTFTWIAVLHLGPKHPDCGICLLSPIGLLVAGCTFFPAVFGSITTFNGAYRHMVDELKVRCDDWKVGTIDNNSIDSVAVFKFYWVIMGIGLIPALISRGVPRKVNPRIGRIFRGLFLISMVSCGGLSIYVLFLSQQIRQEVMTQMGSASADNLWGFGQIVALFLWVPLLLKLMECGIRLRRLGAKEDFRDEGDHDEALALPILQRANTL